METFEGCGSGYWAQSQHFDSWTAFAPTDLVRNVFDVSGYLTDGKLDLNGDGVDDNFLDALRYRGASGTLGAAGTLLRSAVAALLNAANPDIDYPRSLLDVISATDAALATNDRSSMLSLASSLKADNALGCPLT